MIEAELPNGIKIRGPPNEVREYIEGLAVEESVEETPKVEIPQPQMAMKIYHTRRQRMKRRSHKWWRKSEDDFLRVNWRTPEHQGDRSTVKHNKKVAKELRRSYTACWKRMYDMTAKETAPTA